MIVYEFKEECDIIYYRFDHYLIKGKKIGLPYWAPVVWSIWK